jgi:prepilin-type processing-associated H-X9-DG protein
MRLPTLPVHRRGSIRALTLIEVLAVLFILILLAGYFLLPELAGRRRHHGHTRIKCVNNLKNLGLALRIFATDNNGKFPWMVPIEQGGSLEELTYDSRIWKHFQVLSNELSTPRILICPSSPQTQATGYAPPNTNSPSPQLQFSHDDHVSYFLTTGVTEEDADRILGGDRNLTRNSASVRGRIRPATNDVFGFTKPGHHEGNGNLLFGDGSVRQVDASGAAQAFKDGLTPIGTNPPPTLLIP